MPTYQVNSVTKDMQRVVMSSMEQNGYRGSSMTREDRQYVQESAKRKMETGEPTEVILHKGERGFGFSIRGGEGMPLFVLRIAEGGPAWNDGRIKVRVLGSLLNVGYMVLSGFWLEIFSGCNYCYCIVFYLFDVDYK